MQGAWSVLGFLIFLFSISFIHCRPNNDPRRGEIYREDEIGRLRRGFKTSALATARGFGKRSFAAYNQPSVRSPFADSVRYKSALRENMLPVMDSSESNRFPLAYLSDLLQYNRMIASVLESKLGEPEKLELEPKNGLQLE